MSGLDNIDVAFDEEFSINYRRFSLPVARFLKKIIYDRDTCDELCQDVFMKVYEKKVRLNPDSPRTLNYLFTVAKNMAIDYLRRRRAEEDKLRSMNLDEAELDRKFYEDVENACLRGEIISTLHDTINSFPEKERDLFMAKNFGNRTGVSLSVENGLSMYLIRQIESEIFRKIRSNLGRFFGYQDK
jgi:RNA polymerase sigma factor (sigma-70 family)